VVSKRISVVEGGNLMGLAGEARAWMLLGFGFLGVVAAAWIFDRVMDFRVSRPRVDYDDSPQAKQTRLATSGAAFALQQVFDPGVEHVIRAEQDARAEEDDSGSGDGDRDETPGSFQAALGAALIRSPIDLEEVRRVLTAARSAGHDWRAHYDEAVYAALGERPYLASSLPPPARVAPRDRA
jgi:hypothetical protein